MRKYLSAYDPSLGELWLIMLALLSLGGNGILALVALIIVQFFPLELEFLTIALYPLIFIVVIPFVFFRAKIRYQERLIKGPPLFIEERHSFNPFHVIVLFLLLLLITPIFNTVTEPLSMWLKMPDWIKELFGSISNHGFWSVLSVVIFAPLLEEWLCRGVALKGLIRRGYSPAAAILWSAFMFGVIHMNPWQSIPAFLMGILFGWIYWRTNSLWTVIFMHAVNNGLSIAISWLFPSLPEDASMLDIVGPHWYPWIYAACFIVLMLILFLLHKKLPKRAPLFKRAIALTQ